MSRGKVIETTLGDLIVAVTDEVRPLVDNRSQLYTVVSFVVNDVLARRQFSARKRSRHATPTRNLAKTGT
jgi:hypothetical protein